MFDAESMVLAKVRASFPEAQEITIKQVVHVESSGCQCSSEPPHTVVVAEFFMTESSNKRTTLSMLWMDSELSEMFLKSVENLQNNGYYLS